VEKKIARTRETHGFIVEHKKPEDAAMLKSKFSMNFEGKR
jgi:hypothetical protein